MDSKSEHNILDKLLPNFCILPILFSSIYPQITLYAIVQFARLTHQSVNWVISLCAARYHGMKEHCNTFDGGERLENRILRTI